MIFSANSCEKILKDDELTLKKESYYGDELRIDGYYHQNSSNIEWTRIFFFYHNGIILESYIENKTGNLEAVTNYSKSRYGIFNIYSNNIKFEKWYPSSGGPLPAYIRSGVIINDTTFIINKSIRPQTGEEKELDQTYHFRQFSPKPDSTNNFIN